MEASKGISALSEMLQGIQRELDVGLESQKEHMLFRLNKGTCVLHGGLECAEEGRYICDGACQGVCALQCR